jgi:hypothetical protein
MSLHNAIIGKLLWRGRPIRHPNRKGNPVLTD